jgi:hypothetical protein
VKLYICFGGESFDPTLAPPGTLFHHIDSYIDCPRVFAETRYAVWRVTADRKALSINGKSDGSGGAPIGNASAHAITELDFE